MMISIVLLLASLLSLIGLFAVVRRRTTSLARLDQLGGRTHPVDVEAFRNLVSPGEDAFLRARLPAREYRAIRRERLHATAEYIQQVAQNAAILMRVGEANRANPDPAIASAGRVLVENALRLRVLAIVALVKIYAALIVPASSSSFAGLANGYQELRGKAIQLGQLQNPARAPRTAAAL